MPKKNTQENKHQNHEINEGTSKKDTSKIDVLKQTFKK